MYTLTAHAKQRAEERGISRDMIRRTVHNGRIAVGRDSGHLKLSRQLRDGSWNVVIATLSDVTHHPIVTTTYIKH